MKIVKGKIINANNKFQFISDAKITIPVIDYAINTYYVANSDKNGEFSFELIDEDYDKLISNNYPIKNEKIGFDTIYVNLKDYPNKQGMLINLIPSKNNNTFKILALISIPFILWMVTRKK